MKQLITRIDDELHAQFKAACALSGANMSRLLEAWIRAYVAEQQARRGANQASASFFEKKP